MNLKDKIKQVDISNLIPYNQNPKKHPDSQIDKIASSIKKFGFTVPILIKGDNEIIAGHGRVEAAKKLGIDEVPAIVRDDLTDAEAKAFRLADNKLAESDWDEDLLTVELEELEEADFDLELTGFDSNEIEEFNIEEEDDKKYTDKIEVPTYEPKREEKPSIEELLDKKRFKELIKKIEESNIDEDKKEFLKLTAYRHIVFDYENIAEFYAHESEEVQELMEDLTLVLIDYDKALEQGFIDFAQNTLEGVNSEG